MAYPRPFGNSFLVDTPALDQLEQRLYVEQKQREAQRQRDIAALDDEFSKNVTNIRDADVDDLTKAYQDYKLLSQATMKQKGGVSPQQQMEVLRKKADMYKLINESKAEMDRAKLLGTAINKDTRGIYDDKAIARMQARLKTPLSKMGSYSELDEKGVATPLDLRDDNNYLYKLGASDFSKDFEYARGKDRDLTPDERIEDPKDPLMWVTKQYKGKNSPIEFYTNLLPRIAGSKEQRDFVLRTELDYPPEKVAALEARYQQLIKDPSYRKRYGLKEGDDIPLSSYDNPVSKAVRIRAMEHAVSNPIIEKVDKIAKNTSAVMDRTEKFRREIQDRIDNRTFSAINMRRNFQLLDEEGKEQYVQTVVDKFGENGQGLPEVVKSYQKKDGKGHEVPVEKVTKNNDGSYNFLVYDVKDKNKIDNDYSTFNVPRKDIEVQVRTVLDLPRTNTGTTKPNSGGNKPPTRKRPY